jgi:hypothetical protein
MSACLVIIRKFNAHSNTNSSRSRLGRDNDGVYELTKEVVDFQRMRLIRETANGDDNSPKNTMSEEEEKAVEHEEEKRNQLYLSAGKFLCEVTDTLLVMSFSEFVAIAADSVLLRESAISLLADIVVSGSYGASVCLLPDALDVGVFLLALETESTSKHVQATRNMRRCVLTFSQICMSVLQLIYVFIRRSSAFMLRHILTQLGDKFFQMDNGLQFQQTIIDTITLYANRYNEDEVVRFHCACGVAAYERMLEDQVDSLREHEERYVPKILKIVPTGIAAVRNK